jgi:uncharacterized phage protein (TIGR01671 family)
MEWDCKEVMMREIKFRAWNKQHARMIDWPECQRRFSLFALENKPHEFMQYTGLKDKHGREIYEGDVVEYNLMGEHVRGAVSWSAVEAAFVKGTGRQGVKDLSSYMTSTVVIGNIYENPELLEQAA